MTPILKLALLVPLAPLAGAIAAGLFGRTLGRTGAHVVTIFGVLVATLVSALIFWTVIFDHQVISGTVYTWAQAGGGLHLELGFLIDSLTATMMLVVSFVSLMVHIYTIGYMADDPGYQRFFSYIALFTFSMLMLVMSNNFLQLFFGWEAVGLVSYLLIGFWFKRPSAIYANLKAFIVNRVGDMGFVLGIGLIYAYCGSLDYGAVFAKASTLASSVLPATDWSVLTVICVCLFIGAMGKSAQFPLHVWLPDSMEGPTPISALIHAATMVTAGIFMVARTSPLFELSETALSFVMVIGAITALFMGLLGIVQNDIKRVIAYSTLSQLGYMTVALGASAYSVAIFHLVTHAFFKALLFLAAGSVIIALHHEQDIRRMGGLWRYMPITWITSVIGALALIGMPGFAGFYSKDSIIEAVNHSQLPGSGFAQFAVTAGVFVTALYTFRMIFLVFHGKERFGAHDEHGQGAHVHEHEHAHAGSAPHESPAVVWVPLVLLAIPSVIAGAIAVQPMVASDYFAGAIFVDRSAHEAMAELSREFPGALDMALDGFTRLPFLLAAAGIAVAWLLYVQRPDLPEVVRARVPWLYRLLDHKYYLDQINEIVFAGGARWIGGGFWKQGDMALIDGVFVNGSARMVGRLAQLIRRVQSGFIYHYAFIMLVGVALMLFVFLTWPYLPALIADRR
ncbi:MAG TPA: NADH-quinone oxidoreductase subunit L [Burkholderiaceae bacterium]|nr:NADH-quinone oxidoreductase subunit L [Burkholderiaceae bacterium]